MRKQPKKQRVKVRVAPPVSHDKAPNGNGSEELRMRIAVLAYSMYEQRGRQHGHNLQDWLTAERMILGDTA